MKKAFCIVAALTAILASCTEKKEKMIEESTISETISALLEKYPETDTALADRGVRQAAALWRAEDGSAIDFKEHIISNYAGTKEDKKALFNNLSEILETINCYNDLMVVDLNKNVTLDKGTPSAIDYTMAAYDPRAHVWEDMFANKVAFTVISNFPHFSLAEKDGQGQGWSRLEWAFARMGDIFTDRIPAEVNKEISRAYADAEAYIAEYNIKMGHLLTEDGRRLFPEGMSLLSHWNLRDEIKSNYASVPDANEKQEMIYQVMQRIVRQEIPQAVINNGSVDWAPYSNRVWQNGNEIEAQHEDYCRYRHIINQFRAFREQDKYCPEMPSAITRNFEGALEMSDAELEEMFIHIISSEQMKQTARLVRERLGRDLRPYDIWYDGFKGRSSIPEDELTAQTRRKYPNAEAFQKDMPRMLGNLGFSRKDAEDISSHIVVEGARGSGHAWPCTGRWEPARLRTRIGSEGMDYKGYNIAVHEFGHNVEMVLDLYMIDRYMLYGVPATGFTEAMAFLFQTRDLQLLGYGKHSLDKESTLDIFWGMYEIMGVSLVDMYMWRWLYQHEDATAAELCEAVQAIAKDVWNKYFEPNMGEHDCVLLAVYSHMVNAPMYLPCYPIGDLIHFQIEEHLAGYSNDREFADELARIYMQGRLTPDKWMKGAVGQAMSVEPVLNAVSKVL